MKAAAIVLMHLVRLRGSRPDGAVAELPPSYEDARAEAYTACRGLALLFGRPVDNRQHEIGDMVRAAYSGGWDACESRLASPDLADLISQAIDTPKSVLDRRPGESDHQFEVRAVQQVVAYGLAKR